LGSLTGGLGATIKIYNQNSNAEARYEYQVNETSLAGILMFGGCDRIIVSILGFRRPAGIAGRSVGDPRRAYPNSNSNQPLDTKSARISLYKVQPPNRTIGGYRRRAKRIRLPPEIFLGGRDFGHEIRRVAPGDTVKVAIWIAGQPERSEAELYALLAEKYPEVREALENSGNPFAVGDLKLSMQVKREYLEMLAADAQAQAQPLLDELKASGYTPSIIQVMAVIIANLPKSLILELASREDVGAIDSADKTVISGTDPSTGMEKPEIVAPGGDIEAISAGGDPVIESGTSFAAPQVAGVAALMIDRYVNVAAWPPVMKAILMTSAVNNAEGPSAIPEGSEPMDPPACITLLRTAPRSSSPRPSTRPFLT
jgi:hypothetical protein